MNATISTGIPVLDTIIQLAGMAYLTASALATVLPKTWRVTGLLARFAADIRQVLGPAAPTAASKAATLPPGAP
jgi:hypothetical protein